MEYFESAQDKQNKIADGVEEYLENKADKAQPVESDATRKFAIEEDPKVTEDLYSKIQETNSMDISEEQIKTIYDWYSAAMLRGKKAPLSESSFTAHFFGESHFEPNYMYGSFDKGFLLGVVKRGIFIPTHNAPKSPFGAISIFRKLGKGDIPVVMAITGDLVELLSSIPGWTKYPQSFPSNFRGEIVEKSIVYNTHPLTKRLEEKGLSFFEEGDVSDSDEIIEQEIPIGEFEASPEETRQYLEEHKNDSQGTQSFGSILENEL